MLKHLKYSVTFPSTSRTLSADLTLTPGYWAITGSNESGKSMIFEIARYLLFGTEALRGLAEDYKTLKAEGVFEISGSDIKITRTARTATMQRGGVTIATGTSTVNAKVVEELGFNLSVFDIACVINQDDIGRLGNMSPRNRRQMVDNVLGLGSLDGVSKWALEEAKLLSRQADTLRTTLVPPGSGPGAVPKNYLPAETRQETLEQHRALSEELSVLEGYLSHELEEPVPPVEPVGPTGVELEERVRLQNAKEMEIKLLKAQIEALPSSAPHSEAELAEMERQLVLYTEWSDASAWLKRHPLPDYTAEDLDRREAYAVYSEKCKRLEALQSRLSAAKDRGSKPCPHCLEDIPHEHDTIVELEALIAELDPGPALAVEPAYNPQHREILAGYDFETARKYALIQAVEPVGLTYKNIADQRTRLQQVNQRRALEQTLVALNPDETCPDWSRMLNRLRAYEADLERYHSLQLVYQDQLRGRSCKQARYAELQGARDTYNEIQQLVNTSTTYDRDLSAWKLATKLFEETSAKIDGYISQAEKYKKVRDMIMLLRGLIKQHVLPSLAKVSSHLIRQMTGGQRNTIAIDDDFNVLVDNQPLDTLSGSGKACANLSIRIGLGQVLTNKIISILFADEIDASMDSFRAAKTADVLNTLKDSVSQILLVSHKPVDSENHIRLGDSSSYDDDQYRGG